jgi:IS605 OrfB family transposase
MILRKTTINLNYSNTNKLKQLDKLFLESKSVINNYIDILWKNNNFKSKSKYVNFKVDTWLSARLQQCLGKQALEIVKSQRKRKKKTKPYFNKNTLNLDSRFITFLPLINSFDIWIKLKSISENIKLIVPSKKHKHFNNFINNEWKIKKSFRLRKVNNNYFIDLYFEKEIVYKEQGETEGLDSGYKKLAVLSDKQVIGKDLQDKISKISGKFQKSKSFKRALITRNNYINKEIKSIDFSNIKDLIVENLKNVKHNSKKNKRINTKFMNKLQRWVYSYFLNKLELYCEISGVHVYKVNPAYTSQTCSNCKKSNKRSRVGEKFKCVYCNFETDADYNASLNIKRRYLESQEFIVPERTN